MVLSMARWVGQVAIVTGASAGIGAAIAEALVEHGVKVVGLARRKDRLDALAYKLSSKRGKLYPIQADVTSEEDIVNAFQWVKQNLGPVHILINNAGVLGPTTLVDGNTEIWRNVFNVNVLGLCMATREAVRDMRANGVSGHIIHINTIGGQIVPNFPGMNVYPASKFAVRALADTLRFELQGLKLKIKITNISPGPVDTEMVADFLRNKEKKYFSEDQIIESESVVDGVVYALSTPPHIQIQELIMKAVDEPAFNELVLKDTQL